MAAKERKETQRERRTWNSRKKAQKTQKRNRVRFIPARSGPFLRSMRSFAAIPVSVLTLLSVARLSGYTVREWASGEIPEFVSIIRPRGNVVAVALAVSWRRS